MASHLTIGQILAEDHTGYNYVRFENTVFVGGILNDIICLQQPKQNR
jgi:hypothetical protein